MAASWALFGAQEPLLGRVLGALGCLLGALGRLLGASSLSGTRPSSILELSGSILDPLGLDFRDFLGWLVACNRPIYLMHELLHETLRGIH